MGTHSTETVQSSKMLKTIALCLLLAALCQAGPWDCNDLEALVNQERRNKGLEPLLCDQHMRWLSRQHIKDAEDAGYKGFVLKGGEYHLDTPKGCNLHSWYSKYPCCYPKDSECGYNHAKLLSGWDDRRSYEMSALAAPEMTPAKAIKQWNGSPPHARMYLEWTRSKTVGCAWKDQWAHCNIAFKFPSTYEGSKDDKPSAPAPQWFDIPTCTVGEECHWAGRNTQCWKVTDCGDGEVRELIED